MINPCVGFLYQQCELQAEADRTGRGPLRLLCPSPSRLPFRVRLGVTGTHQTPSRGYDDYHHAHDNASEPWRLPLKAVALRLAPGNILNDLRVFSLKDHYQYGHQDLSVGVKMPLPPRR